MKNNFRPEYFLNIISQYLTYTKDGLLIIDTENSQHTIVYGNNGFIKLTGYQLDEIIGKSIDILNGENTSEKTAGKITKCIKSNKNGLYDIIHYKKDGTKFWNMISITPVFNPTCEKKYSIVICKDITKSKEKYIEIIELNTLKISIETVSDILFNYMNYLSLFRNEILELVEKNNVEDIKKIMDEFDESYKDAFKRIIKLQDIESFEKKKLTKNFEIIDI